MFVLVDDSSPQNGKCYPFFGDKVGKDVVDNGDSCISYCPVSHSSCFLLFNKQEIDPYHQPMFKTNETYMSLVIHFNYSNCCYVYLFIFKVILDWRSVVVVVVVVAAPTNSDGNSRCNSLRILAKIKDPLLGTLS